MQKPADRPARIADERGAAFTVVGGRADAGLLVLCDHASNALPPEYGTLGLPEAQLQRHIGYDIGAAAVTRRLAAHFDAPAVLTHYSRLLIDPNRGLDDPTLIMRLSDGAVVPGNRNLDAREREKRIERYWLPYHRAVSRVIDDCLASGLSPVILAIHSFTESWKGVSRPWHVGVLWDTDDRLARPMIEAFAADGQLIVGDNQPYKGSLDGDCMHQHASSRGLVHALIEYRQDLIRDDAGQAAWADRTIAVIETLRARSDLRIMVPAPMAELASAAPDHQSASSPTKGPAMAQKFDAQTQTELEAAAYRRLVEHLRSRTDVQNIDLMNMAGFCRNCLANWFQEAATGKGHAISKDEAREIVYGMPYKDWQAKHQKDATPEQKAAYEKSKPHSH